MNENTNATITDDDCTNPNNNDQINKSLPPTIDSPTSDQISKKNTSSIFDIILDSETDEDSDDFNQQIQKQNTKSNPPLQFLFRINSFHGQALLTDKYITRSQKNKFSIFHGDYMNTDEKKYLAQKFQTMITKNIESGKAIVFQEPLTSINPQNRTQNQLRTFQLDLNEGTIKYKDSGDSFGDVNIFNMLSLNEQPNIWKNQRTFNAMGYCTGFEQRNNYGIWRVHLLDHELSVYQSVILAIKGNDWNLDDIIPQNSIFIALNISAVYHQLSKSYRLYITWSDIINHPESYSLISAQIQLNEKQKYDLQRMGLKMASNNVSRPGWNFRELIQSVSDTELVKHKQKTPLRISQAKITDISINPVCDKCAHHRVPIKEGECTVSNCTAPIVTHTQYNCNITVEDALGNNVQMRPHWNMMKEICGQTIDQLEQEFTKRKPMSVFKLKFGKWFKKICAKKKTFTVDFLIADEVFDWTRINPRKLFCIQIHTDNQMNPITQDRIYIKAPKKQSYYNKQ